MTDTLERLLACRPTELPIQLLTHLYMGRTVAFNGSLQCSATNRSVSDELSACVERTSKVCGSAVDELRRLMTTADKCSRIIDWFRRRRLNATTRWIFDDERRRFFEKMPDLIGDRLATKPTLPMFEAHRRCIARLDATVRPCWESTRAVCASASTITAKVVRVALADLEPTIQRVPDVRLIHYVRDPRAIAVSRKVVRVTFSTDDDRLSTESRLLCRTMLEDLRAKRLLERRYPGAILTVRYEDFTRDIVGTTERVFSTIGRPCRGRFGAGWTRSSTSRTRVDRWNPTELVASTLRWRPTPGRCASSAATSPP